MNQPTTTPSVPCAGKGCPEPAILMVVDNLEPVVQRAQFGGCAAHVRLWHRQARGSFWFFPLGDGEADSLSDEQVRQALSP